MVASHSAHRVISRVLTFLLPILFSFASVSAQSPNCENVPAGCQACAAPLFSPNGTQWRTTLAVAAV
eukprot:1706152-Rhodomonas_salina.2